MIFVRLEKLMKKQKQHRDRGRDHGDGRGDGERHRGGEARDKTPEMRNKKCNVQKVMGKIRQSDANTKSKKPTQ